MHVNQMEHHLGFLAIYFFLARMMKMKLHERILLAVHGNAASCLILNEDGMAVVDDCHRRELVIKFDCLQIRRCRSLDVDGRLALSGFAGSETRVEIAPMLRAVDRNNSSEECRWDDLARRL